MGRRDPVSATPLAAEQGLQRRREMLVVAAVAVVYLVGLVFFWPDVVTNVDEAAYLRQAAAFTEGSTWTQRVDPLTGDVVDIRPWEYPPGNAALLSGPMALLGWRGAYLIPGLGFAALLLVTAQWLREAGRSPLFALLASGFLPALVLGRVAMSDVPAAALSAVGLWCFWRGRTRGFAWWLASGCIAGALVTFRTQAPLVFAFLFLGALLRRNRHVWALVAGGLAGLSMRLVGNRVSYGSATQMMNYVGFESVPVPESVVVQSIALLALVPWGLLLSCLYRGERRPEIIATVLVYFGLHVFYRYGGASSGFPKALVLGPRFLMTVLPVVCFAFAEAFPRLWRRFSPRAKKIPEGSPLLTLRAPRIIAGVWILANAAAVFAIHPAMWSWSRDASLVQEAIARHVGRGDEAIITNPQATVKFVNEIHGYDCYVDYRSLTPGKPADEAAEASSAVALEIARRHGEAYIVLLARGESADWREEARQQGVFLDAVAARMNVACLLDKNYPEAGRLRIWKITPAD